MKYSTFLIVFSFLTFCFVATAKSPIPSSPLRVLTKAMWQQAPEIKEIRKKVHEIELIFKY